VTKEGYSEILLPRESKAFPRASLS